MQRASTILVHSRNWLLHSRNYNIHAAFTSFHEGCLLFFISPFLPLTTFNPHLRLLISIFDNINYFPLMIFHYPFLYIPPATGFSCFLQSQSMDNLLCDEVWLSTTASPSAPDSYGTDYYCSDSFYTTKEDCEKAICVCLQKELAYMPEPGYLEHLLSEKLFFARFKAIQWLVKARSRLNLSFVTLFNAATYLDRFISMNQFHGWKNWMVELLSIACLSVASKFSETSPPTLHEIQMEDLDHSFQSITIQRMELILLQTLEWRLGSTTAYSYVELLTMNIDPSKTRLPKELVARVTELLVGAILDCQLVEYRPNIACVSALWCSLQELLPSKSEAHLAYLTGFFNQNQKDDIMKCHKYMKEAKLVNPVYNLAGCANGNSSYCPSSPVTVLLTERIELYDSHVDLSFFKDHSGSNSSNRESIQKRRKRMN